MLTCKRCGFVCAIGSRTIHCLRPTCTWERPLSEAARRRLIADVLARPAVNRTRRAA